MVFPKIRDQNRALTIKGGTRKKRGAGTRQRVSGTAKIPGDWNKFLTNLDNKNELFSFLTRKLLTDGLFPDDKNVYVTAHDQVHHVGNISPMDQCNHEEADTSVLVHFLHALQTSSLGMVHTGDTDVVIRLSNFHHIMALNAEAEIWISFKAGKTTRMISLNTITTNLVTATCKAMALFHAFTGSDSTSSFKFKGK